MQRAYSGLDLRGCRVVVDPPAQPGDLATHAFVAERTDAVRTELRQEVIAQGDELRQELTSSATNPTVALGNAALFIGPKAPAVPAGTPYLWLQTGINGNGGGYTLWFEDGTT